MSLKCVLLIISLLNAINSSFELDGFLKDENNTESIKQVHILFRHGERSPTDTYPNDPYKNYQWPQGWGHLTNRGKLQMYKLGMNIRKNFRKIIPKHYSVTEVEVHSSYSDRCLMSAELMCAGLFPPSETQVWNPALLWQPIPVFYKPRNEDNLIAMKKKCNEYDKELETVTRRYNKEMNSKYSHFLQYLSDHTGEKIDTVDQVERLFNTLEIEILHNFTMPEWINSTVLTITKQLATDALGLYSVTAAMQKLKGGVFLKEIVDNFENEKRLFLYAGHDMTILHVLRALHNPMTFKAIKPQFGAAIIFIVYKDASMDVYYQENYRADPVEIFTDYRIKSIALPGDWEKDCGNEEESESI